MQRVKGLLVAISVGTALILLLSGVPQASDEPRAYAGSPPVPAPSHPPINPLIDPYVRDPLEQGPSRSPVAASTDEPRPVPQGHRRLLLEVVDACSGETLPKAKIRIPQPDRPSPHPPTRVPGPLAVGPALWEVFVRERSLQEFVVHADGYFSGRVIANPGRPEEGQTLKQVVRLNNSPRTLLRVVDREGRPVGGAQVEVQCWQERRTATTDANGCALFEPFAGRPIWSASRATSCARAT